MQINKKLFFEIFDWKKITISIILLLVTKDLSYKMYSTRYINYEETLHKSGFPFYYEIIGQHCYKIFNCYRTEEINHLILIIDFIFWYIVACVMTLVFKKIIKSWYIAFLGFILNLVSGFFIIYQNFFFKHCGDVMINNIPPSCSSFAEDYGMSKFNIILYLIPAIISLWVVLLLKNMDKDKKKIGAIVSVIFGIVMSVIYTEQFILPSVMLIFAGAYYYRENV